MASHAFTTSRRALLVAPFAPPARRGTAATEQSSSMRRADLTTLDEARVAFATWATASSAEECAAAFLELEAIMPAYGATEARMNAALRQGRAL